MRFDRTWIAAHMPHQGRMCLLDSVLSWDPDSIHCSASSHRLPDHPLRAHGRLGAACLIEYAAQAMAVHGALLTGSSARAVPAATIGMLASARSVELLITDLDSISGDLSIRAHRRHGDARGALYEFEVGSATQVLARGRASVLLEVAGHGSRAPA